MPYKCPGLVISLMVSPTDRVADFAEIILEHTSVFGKTLLRFTGVAYIVMPSSGENPALNEIDIELPVLYRVPVGCTAVGEIIVG